MVPAWLPRSLPETLAGPLPEVGGRRRARAGWRGCAPFLRSVAIVGLVVAMSWAGVGPRAAGSPRGASQPPDQRFDAARAFGYLVAQCALGPRNPGGPGHARCREFLTAWFAERCSGRTARFWTQDFVHVDSASGERVSLTNFVAVFEGENPADQPLLFCAHWDTRPRADREADPARRTLPILGANDGASGVAVLMELAALLSAEPPPQTVYIVLFDGEDYGDAADPGLKDYFLGSRYFAAHLPTTRFGFGVLLDMVGDRDLRLPYEGFSLERNPELTRRIWDRARELGLREFAPERGPWVFDDHLPLMERGLAMVDIIDFEYPYWHTLQDTPERCSSESLAVVGRLVVDLAYGGVKPR